MAGHAILSPSAASRWLSCTPSARFEAQFPDRAGQAAAEGTLAHTLGELLISKELGLVKLSEYRKKMLAITKSPLFGGNEMLEHADNYCTFVMERFSDAKAHTKDALIFLEQKLNLTDYVPEGFGTGDVCIIADSVLDIVDLKYGKGVPVSASDNKQMMLYSLGALREFDFIYDIHTVRMTIFQPRLDSISTFEMSVTELRKWAEDELKPKAELAFKGEGEFVAGAHCKFCKAAGVCRTNMEKNMEIAKYDFKKPDMLTDEEVSDIMNRSIDFIPWLNAVSDHALREAIENGKKWPDYKLVEGRSNRKYSDETLVVERLTQHGITEDKIYDKKIKGITSMEKEIGKQQFGTWLEGLIVKPPGKPTLVHASDKRPELNSAEAAAADFSQ